MQKLSILMPVYNEKDTILKIIEEIKKAKLKNLTKEMIIVDDFSTDGTRNILRNIKDSSIKIYYHNRNQGKGAAVRTAISNSTGGILLVQDADLEYSPKEYNKLLQPIMEKKADIVYGSRFESIRKNLKKMYKLHYIGNLFLTSMTNVLYGTKISDMETGFKVFRRKVISNMNLKSKRFDFEPEITSKILKRGYKIHEVPIVFTARKFSEGKKITWKDGVKAAYCLLKYRFVD